MTQGPRRTVTDSGDEQIAASGQGFAYPREPQDVNLSLEQLADKYGWGSREVQDAYDYRMGLVPDAD